MNKPKKDQTRISQGIVLGYLSTTALGDNVSLLFGGCFMAADTMILFLNKGWWFSDDKLTSYVHYS